MASSRLPLRIRIRRAAIRIWDGLEAYAAAGITFVVGLVLVGLFIFLFGVGSADDLASWTVAAFFAAAAVWTGRRASRRDSILTEIAMTQMAGGSEDYLDLLLARLIGGAWRRKAFRSGDRLFDALLKVAEGANFEMKRRLAEALPALGLEDAKRTMQLVDALRDDWHEERWHDDIRRRALEALVTPSTGSKQRMIDFVGDAALARLLRPRPNDRVYTAMAAIECLAVWKPRDAGLIGPLRTDWAMHAAELDPAADGALKALYLGRSEAEAHSTSGLEMVEAMAASPSILERLAAARTLAHIDATPGRIIDLANGFLDEEVSGSTRHIRRPIAREAMVRRFIDWAEKGKYTQESRTILTRLLSDIDAIIADTTFDLVEDGASRQVQILAVEAVLDNRAIGVRGDDQSLFEALRRRAERTQIALESA